MAAARGSSGADFGDTKNRLTRRCAPGSERAVKADRAVKGYRYDVVEISFSEALSRYAT